ncbi:MAG: ferritin family protein [Armatimonadota bacterium]
MDNDAREDVQAVCHAIRMENVGYGFYEKLADTTADPNAKKLFTRLRDEEVQHLGRVRQELERIVGPAEAVGVEEQAMAEPAAESWWVFPEEGDPAVDERTREIKAVEVALQAEQRAREFYQEWTQKAADPEGREMYEWLTEMEDEHVKLLQWELDGLTGSGHWFDIAEFDMEGC